MRRCCIYSILDDTVKLPNWLKKEIKIPMGKRSRPPPWFRKLSKAIKIAFLLLLVWFVLWRCLLGWEINCRFATIRAAGLPTSGQELNKWRPQVPDAQNAALVLTQAFALLHTFPDRRSNEVTEPKLLAHRTSWSAETRSLVAEYVKMNEAAIDKAREALRRPHCRYEIDFSYGPDTDFSHLGKLKILARVAALQAALALEQSDGKSGADEIRLTLKLAASLDGDPALVSHLVQNGIIRLATRTTERNLAWFTPDESFTEEVSEALAMREGTNGLALALTGERAMMVPVFRLSWSEIQASSKAAEDGVPRLKHQRYSGKPNPFLWLSGFFERDLNFYLQMMETNISLATLAPPASLIATNMAALFGETPSARTYPFAGMVLPSIARCFVREAGTDAPIRLARMALALERFRLTRGRLPEDLRELTPQFLEAIPLDPFGGTPLRYRRLAKGYVIYSVGPDGRDDNGREEPERKKSTDTNSYDITFTVER
jgi:hypothetical protein